MLILNKTDMQNFKLQLEDETNLIIATHDGLFHAHDVMQVALFVTSKYVAYDSIIVIRTRDGQVLNQLYQQDNVFIHDVGMQSKVNWLDHHQSGFKYVSLDQMFFPCTTRKLSTSQVQLLHDICLIDNGMEGFDFVNTYISSFNKSWNENKETNQAFLEAIDAAIEMLENAPLFIALRQREIVRKQGERDAKSSIDHSLEKMINNCTNYISLERFMPWQEIVGEYNKVSPDERRCLFVIFPDVTGTGYRLQAVSESKGSFKNLLDITAEKGSNGCTFIHTNKFIAGFDTEEQAVKCAEENIKSLHSC